LHRKEITRWQRKKGKTGADRKRSRTRAYPIEFRLRIVKLFCEESYSAALLSSEFGISQHSIRRWVRSYRRGGVDGLEPKPHPGGKPSVPPDTRRGWWPSSKPTRSMVRTAAVKMQTFALPAGTRGQVVRIVCTNQKWFRVHEVELSAP
jgi:transposase-like protein